MAAPVSILNRLSEEERQKLIGWLEVLPTREVRDRVAHPPPEGLGIETHVTTLKRFYARHRAENRSEENDIARLFAKPGASDPLDSATHSLTADWAFQLAASPRRNVAGFKALSRWILKIRDQQHNAQALALAEKRLALDREKMELNTSRMALKNMLKLQEIYRAPNMDDEDRIRAARLHLFGSAPD